jgi:hypothetical protein
MHASPYHRWKDNTRSSATQIEWKTKKKLDGIYIEQDDPISRFLLLQILGGIHRPTDNKEMS